MNKFDNVIDIAKMICGFIFSHSEEMPANVTELVFGISTSYVTVHFRGYEVDDDILGRDLPGLFEQIRGKDGQNLTVVSFTPGHAVRFECTRDRQSRAEREDTALEGTLFRVTTSDGKNTFLEDREAFFQAIADVFSTNGSAPDPEKMNVFLNGSAIRVQPRSEHTLR